MYQQNQYKNRKLDARKKIELGGLLIKTGFGDFDKATILGMLIDCAQQLKDHPGKKDLWKVNGQMCFDAKLIIPKIEDET